MHANCLHNVYEAICVNCPWSGKDYATYLVGILEFLRFLFAVEVKGGAEAGVIVGVIVAVVLLLAVVIAVVIVRLVSIPISHMTAQIYLHITISFIWEQYSE